MPEETVPRLASPMEAVARAPIWARLKRALALASFAYVTSTLSTLALTPTATPSATVTHHRTFYAGILRPGQPRGFPVTPKAYDLSHGPGTVDFLVPVTNLTNRRQRFVLHFVVSHILTLNGANVADGQPGQPGIHFITAKGTTQKILPGYQTFAATWRPKQRRWLVRTYNLHTCGYFQIDIAAHQTPLAFGFIRALGCPTSQVQAITPPATGGLRVGDLPTLGVGSSLLAVGGCFVLFSARRRRRY